ncbi:transmembrane emp24 domain-containing protein p24delta4-like isoform X1 [Populus alba x Populus x berolinensis]|nr:transmembrane emp24 domain-containing protein p24delta4-like isoform X1 [Populus alba x Populus x berolinensis]
MARNCRFTCWITILVPVAEAIWLSIPNWGSKCVSEEIQNGVVVLSDYYVLNEEHPEHPVTVTVRFPGQVKVVTSPYGNNLHHNENVTHGQFAFTTSEGGNYLACFTLDGHQEPATGVTLSLDWKIGIAAKDWDSVAKKEKIEGVELEVRKLKDHAEAIHNNLLYLKQSFLPLYFYDEADTSVEKEYIAFGFMFLKSTTGLNGIIQGFVMSDKTCETESSQAKPKAPQTFKGALISSLKYLKTREMEADMREVSEKTNSRVAWYSIMSLGVCIVVSVLQLWHLKSYFQKKKLI